MKKKREKLPMLQVAHGSNYHNPIFCFCSLRPTASPRLTWRLPAWIPRRCSTPTSRASWPLLQLPLLAGKRKCIRWYPPKKFPPKKFPAIKFLKMTTWDKKFPAKKFPPLKFPAIKFPKLTHGPKSFRPKGPDSLLTVIMKRAYYYCSNLVFLSEYAFTLTSSME